MSVTDIFDGGEKEAAYLKTCNQGELNGMYLSAARMGDWPRIERLLDAGAQLNYAGGAAFSAAIDGNHIELARNLVKLGIDTTRSKQEALSDAVYAGFTDAVAYLVDEAGADPSFNDSAALFSAVVNNRPEMTKLLLEKGADVQANKGTLLCIALSHGFEKTAVAMLEGGADPRRNYRDMNAYEWAAEMGLPGFSAKLRDWVSTDVYMSPGFFRRQTVAELRGFYDDKQKQSGFYLAARAGCFDIVRDKILAAPGEKLQPDDLTRLQDGRRNVLTVLGEEGQLDVAFDPRLWAGRKEEALNLLEKNLPKAFQEQVDIPRLAAEIDLLTLKARVKPAGLKPKMP